MALGMEIQNLRAWYGKVKALQDINLTVVPGAVTAIIGPSGCGKSTFIRCLNRLHEVVRGARASGQVWLGDLNIYGRGVDPVLVRRRIGMVFQKPNPFPAMSIFDNVAAGLHLDGVPRQEIYGRVEMALRLAGLWDEVRDRLQVSGANLSGGQQQRLCLARALALEPEVLLLDEPCSALDPASTMHIEAVLRDLKGRYTVVIVTHNMQQASRVADYTAFFLTGEVVEYGSTEDIFTRPRDERTENYITGRFG
ncbi:MAG: phosphate ABC transporter ATP-binding protein [Clostridia bacterium]|nr:MAG: phosphate ABC transporter ATP-binding protein [Clostridia bacterium]